MTLHNQTETGEWSQNQTANNNEKIGKKNRTLTRLCKNQPTGSSTWPMSPFIQEGTHTKRPESSVWKNHSHLSLSLSLYLCLSLSLSHTHTQTNIYSLTFANYALCETIGIIPVFMSTERTQAPDAWYFQCRERNLTHFDFFFFLVVNPGS